ncbi:MAG: hypothetical protein E7329_11800 [Clostridiales bacterium]|nr:hypothetical protein [Clostridiales bacterium]
MTGKSSFQQTATPVHTMDDMLSQRSRALALDQCALSGVSLYGQLTIGIAFYLYAHVSTPGYLSILITLPYLLLMSLGGWWLARQTPSSENAIQWAVGKKAEKPLSLCFSLIFLLDAQLAFYALTAMMQNVLPDMSTFFISLAVALTTAITISGGDEYALHRLTRFLRWIFLLVFLYCAITSLPYGSIGHLFPLLGHGTGSIFQGALWMCGCLGGAACPLIMPQQASTHSALCEKRGAFLRPQFFALLAGACTALLSAYLMPVYALARPETLGWRMLLITHVNPSQMGWSLFLCGQMFLMLITLSAGVTRAAALITHTLRQKNHKPFLITLLLFFLLPIAALDLSAMDALLIQIAPFRGIAALLLMLLLLLCGLIKKRKAAGKEAGA